MSSRLKRRKNPRKSKNRKNWRRPGKLGQSEKSRWVETPAGSFLGEPRGTDGWMVLEACDVNPDIPQEQVMQQCGCPDTGETYVRPFEQRYLGWPEHTLLQLREELLQQLAELNGGEEPPLMMRGPLWLEVEFVENVLNFELRPPCGCQPKVAVLSDSQAC